MLESFIACLRRKGSGHLRGACSFAGVGSIYPRRRDVSSYVRTLLDKLAVARLLVHQVPDVHVEFNFPGGRHAT